MLDLIRIYSGGSDFDFNIDSGINIIDLFASIGGLVLLLAAPIVGEFALFGELVLGAIGIVKSVWSFLIQTIKNPNKEKKRIRI